MRAWHSTKRILRRCLQIQQIVCFPARRNARIKTPRRRGASLAADFVRRQQPSRSTASRHKGLFRCADRGQGLPEGDRRRRFAKSILVRGNDVERAGGKPKLLGPDLARNGEPRSQYRHDAIPEVQEGIRFRDKHGKQQGYREQKTIGFGEPNKIVVPQAGRLRLRPWPRPRRLPVPRPRRQATRVRRRRGSRAGARATTCRGSAGCWARGAATRRARLASA